MDQNCDFQFHIRENIVFCIVCMLSNAKKSPGMHCSRKNRQTIAVTLCLRFVVRVNEAEQCYYFDDSLRWWPQPTQDDIEMKVCTNNKHIL